MAFRDALDAFKVFRSVPFFASILGALEGTFRGEIGWEMASRGFLYHTVHKNHLVSCGVQPWLGMGCLGNMGSFVGMGLSA